MIKIGAPLEHTLDQPLGLLSDCHRRIEHFLDTLIRVADTVGTGPLTPQAQSALEASLHYFRGAGPMHSEDEEESLFPRLREVAKGEGSKAEKAAEVLVIAQRLEADHEAADKRHVAIDEIGRRWIKEGKLPADEVSKLQKELRDLRAFYADHISVEDNHVFPVSESVLDAGQVKEIGKEMAARRGKQF